MTGLEAGPWPRTWSDFWRLTNRPRPFTPRGLELAASVLVLIYVPLAIVRHEPEHPEFVLLRGAVCVLGVIGRVFARRLTWNGLRTFVVATGFLLPFEAAWVGATLGNHVQDLALTALACFVSVAFLQTSFDVVLVSTGLLAGHAVILAAAAPPGEPLATVAFFLGGATASGAVAALTMMMYRAGLRESMTWWQQACERERSLREFAELTASAVGEATLLDRLAEAFRATFGDGRCGILLAGEDGAFRFAGASGYAPEADARLRGTQIPDRIADLLREVVAQREPVVREDLTAEQCAAIERRWGRPVGARALVALPVVVGDAVAAVVFLSATTPRRFSENDLLLWTTMARQAGVALAHTQLLARLQHALSAKSEFLNTMSHELRSPLHVVVGYADMLREEAPDADQARLAGRIRASALDLLRLVEETMSASRLEAGRVTVRADEFAPAEVVEELSEAVQALPEAQGPVPVHWEVAADLPLVRLDRLKVKEIVQNLVSNALKFTPRGEVRVRVGRRGERLRIEVYDTGMGIPTEAQGRIFDMFERVETSGGQRLPGVGLGLYIVHSLVGLMGGSIELQSSPGEGSLFTVDLPFVLDEAA